jgi:hypothetical protein
MKKEKTPDKEIISVKYVYKDGHKIFTIGSWDQNKELDTFHIDIIIDYLKKLKLETPERNTF